MRKVSVRPKLIVLSSISTIIFLIGFILLILMKIKFDTFILIFMASSYFSILFFIYLNNSDIYLNDACNKIIIRSVFKEKKYSINDIIIKDYIPSSRVTFIFDTNKERLYINYTKNNYDTLLEFLNLIKYRGIDLFIKDIEERSSFTSLEYGQWRG